ncbi:MAG: hypothetical protein AMS25_18865 [Gemmatimonas sp. SM23_52]|nr:MAG: hypothetical protein AMS25_18865 [Gemmatimonas sp. SM23_52]
MTAPRGELGRIVGFGAVTLVFAVTQPLVLIGIPLALLLVAVGPRGPWSAVIVGAVVAVALMGDRSGLWWFERGWPLILAGIYVLSAAACPTWSFSARALTSLGLAVTGLSLVFLVSPGAWRELDASMAGRASQAASAATELLGGAAEESVRALVGRVAGLQAALFPALLGVSSLGALGVAATLRGRLAGDVGRRVGGLRGFSFNDHLVWVWLLGLALVVAPMGEVAERIGGNAVFFMGTLYVVRGVAVLLTLAGGISALTGVVGAVLAVLIYPILALFLGTALLVGLSDTWLNVRGRIKARSAGRGPSG